MLNFMTEDELLFIESSCGVSLPKVYREWFLSLPPKGDGEGWEWFFNRVDSIIYDNLMFQKDGFCGEIWHPFLFCIGGSDGNYAFIDLKELSKTVGRKFPIYCTDHEDGPVYTSSNWRECLITGQVPFFG